MLGCFRFACDSIPTVWLAADGLGWMLGRLAGWLAGIRLEVGATFGGIDFLVLTAAIYAGWLICTAPPRRSRALWAAAAIVVGHFVYLIVLAYSEKLLAAPARRGSAAEVRHQQRRHLDVEQRPADADPVERAAAGDGDPRRDCRGDGSPARRGCRWSRSIPRS